MIYIDFETEKIQPRPDFPPRAVGVAIKEDDKPGVYYAWGHPSNNNSSWEEAREALAAVWGGELCFHNAKFDLSVAQAKLGLSSPPWRRIHDTMFLLFLDDPNQESMGLKQAASRLLNMPPDEQEDVRDYLVKMKVGGRSISAAPASPMYFGGYISLAPGDLVGKYAIGDVERTQRLFELLVDRVPPVPYARERQLLLILMEMEELGIPTSPDLAPDLARYSSVLTEVDSAIADYLGMAVAVDSSRQLLNALLSAGKIDMEKLKRTDKGSLSAAKGSLSLAITDPRLNETLRYRRQLATTLTTFMSNWARGRGRIYTSWNQVKGSDYGARTGRISSTPNFQNIPTQHTVGEMIEEFPPLPDPRRYIIPFAGHVLIDRDYSQQELRVMAHFEDGKMMRAYQENPWLDLHEQAREILAAKGMNYTRKQVKMTNLGILYGMGAGKLAEATGLSLGEAKELKATILEIYPGLQEMMWKMKQRAMHKQSVTTWGGRKFLCEPPRMGENGELRTFDYKMLNTLIQGSSADATKEALIRFYKAKKPEWKVILLVHDQITVSVPMEDENEAHECLRVAMESVEFDVKLLTEGKTGRYNWSSLENKL